MNFWTQIKYILSGNDCIIETRDGLFGKWNSNYQQI